MTMTTEFAATDSGTTNEDAGFSSAFTDGMSSAPSQEAPVQTSTETVSGEAEAPTSSQASAQPVQQTQPNQLMQAAARLGLQVTEGQSPEEIAMAAMRRLHEASSGLQMAQQFAPHMQQFQAYLESQKAAQKPETPAEPEWTPESHFEKAWGGPQWNPRYDELIQNGMMVIDDETNLYKPAPGYELSLAQEAQSLNEAQSYRAKFWQNLTKGNPYESIYKSMLEPMQRQWKQDIDQYIQERERASKIDAATDSFLAENSSWMYAQDPLTGQRVTTPEGEKFLDTVRWLKSKGLEDNIDILDIATKMHGVQQKPAQQAVQQSNTGGHGASQVQSPQQTFLDSAKNKAMHKPSPSGRSADDTAPEDLRGADLENVFVRALGSRK